MELASNERLDDGGPLGATVSAGGVRFRVWAPDAEQVELKTGEGRVALERSNGGIWSIFVPGLEPGLRYGFVVDERGPFADPYCRSQPDGPHRLSEVVDPSAFTWHDEGWTGLTPDGLVIYEIHVGAYTPEGTFDALAAELPALKALGVTAIELMPVAEFPGTRNWGYDGVDLFAPSRMYGGAEALRRLVDQAHALGLGVILDVVYNHFGPEGNYLLQYSKDYITGRHPTKWGDAVNFDGEQSAMVRQYVIDNVCSWILEYHIDGLRVDATFSIFDDSPRHILEEITSAARAAAGERRIVLIAETCENDERYLRPQEVGGYGFDAVWADDFHHVVHVLSTGERRDYYGDYAGTLEELAATINRGWLSDGGATGPSGDAGVERLAASALVWSLQNHDQVGNRPFGERLSQLAGADLYRAWTALFLLSPYTPLLFMGEEFGASSPFLFFTDHETQLARPVREGRRREFPYAEDPTLIPDPQALETFERSKLRRAERESLAGQQTFALYQALLELRRTDAVLSSREREQMHAYASDGVLFVERWDVGEGRLIAVNTGEGLNNERVQSMPEHTRQRAWRLLFSTDDRRFGGAGAPAHFDCGLLTMPARAATVFRLRLDGSQGDHEGVDSNDRASAE